MLINYNTKLSDIVKQIIDASITIKTFMSDGHIEIGSGFFVSHNIAVTCAHVVGINKGSRLEDIRSIMVTLNSGEHYYATILDYNLDLDIAIIFLNIPSNKKNYFLNLGNSGTIMTGEAVVSIGTPLGYTNTISYGIIANNTLENDKRFFLLDLSANPGNSGGMIYSLDKSAIIGVCAAIIVPKNVVSSGLTVGVGIDLVKQMLRKNKIKFVFEER